MEMNILIMHIVEGLESCSTLRDTLIEQSYMYLENAWYT